MCFQFAELILASNDCEGSKWNGSRHRCSYSRGSQFWKLGPHDGARVAAYVRDERSEE
jgi:hypothetical protein